MPLCILEKDKKSVGRKRLKSLVLKIQHFKFLKDYFKLKHIYDVLTQIDLIKLELNLNKNILLYTYLVFERVRIKWPLLIENRRGLIIKVLKIFDLIENIKKNV